MIVRKTKVIGGSFIHEGEAAGRSRIPGVSRNHVENGLQLRFIDIDRQPIPLNDAAVPIAQRLTTSMVPTEFAIRATQTDDAVVQGSSLNRVTIGPRGLGKVVRVHERLPTELLEILELHAAVVQEALTDVGRLSVWSGRPDQPGHGVDDLAQLVFALLNSLLGLFSIVDVDEDAVPAQHLAVVGPQGFCANREPAISAVRSAKSAGY